MSVWWEVWRTLAPRVFVGQDAKAVVVPRGEAAPRHIGRFRGCGPLVRIESRGVKQLRRRGGITSFAVLERRHVEVQEHAEAQIDELLLQIEQRSATLNPTRCLLRPVILFGSKGSATGEHGQSCSFGGQSKKISSCRHAGKSGNSQVLSASY
jgi:hypothetical protein